MKSPRIRYGLIREVMVMAFDTVRSNKLRSGLTVLGVVIGITSIVAMTALIVVFAEVMPKAYAINHPDRTALAVAPTIRVFITLLAPVANMLIPAAHHFT